MDKDYSFTIRGGYTPKTIPMERLAEYMAALARMLGEEAYVHFGGVVKGSVKLRVRLDEPAKPKVRERMHAVRLGTASSEVKRQYTVLDDMLRRDNASAALAGGDNVVIPFPGKNRAEPAVFGPFRQYGTIDGEVYRIGGKDASKHVHVHSGDRDLSVLYASEEVAKRLRYHLFGEALRFRGEGTWVRHGDGTWELRGFRIDDFDPLGEESLLETVSLLRAAGRHDLGDDPVTTVLASRHGTDGEAA